MALVDVSGEPLKISLLPFQVDLAALPRTKLLRTIGAFVAAAVWVLTDGRRIMPIPPFNEGTQLTNDS